MTQYWCTWAANTYELCHSIKVTSREGSESSQHKDMLISLTGHYSPSILYNYYTIKNFKRYISLIKCFYFFPSFVISILCDFFSCNFQSLQSQRSTNCPEIINIVFLSLRSLFSAACRQDLWSSSIQLKEAHRNYSTELQSILGAELPQRA